MKGPAKKDPGGHVLEGAISFPMGQRSEISRKYRGTGPKSTGIHYRQKQQRGDMCLITNVDAVHDSHRKRCSTGTRADCTHGSAHVENSVSEQITVQAVIIPLGARLNAVVIVLVMIGAQSAFLFVTIRLQHTL